MSEQQQKLLLTENEVLEIVGTHRTTWRRWVAAGVAPKPVQIGKGLKPAIRYRRYDIEEWIADGCPIVE